MPPMLWGWVVQVSGAHLCCWGVGWAELQCMEHSHEEEQPKALEGLCICMEECLFREIFLKTAFCHPFCGLSQENPVPDYVPGQELKDFGNFWGEKFTSLGLSSINWRLFQSQEPSSSSRGKNEWQRSLKKGWKALLFWGEEVPTARAVPRAAGCLRGKYRTKLSGIVEILSTMQIVLGAPRIWRGPVHGF